MKRERSDIDDALEQEIATLRNQIAAKDVEIRNLEKQLGVAEDRNSRLFPSGESFLDTGATPHLLNRGLERVFTTSGNFTKLVMQSLKRRGVDCTATAKRMAQSVIFERDAHTKFFYQALICKALFTDFEHEYFNVEGNAPETILDPEERTKENFERYKELIAIEDPESLLFEGEFENDFRRLCNAKRKGLVAALGTLGFDPLHIFADIFGPEGIRKRESAGAAARLASSFAKVVLSVFVVHKLAFALRPIARIFRVLDGMRFSDCYMEPVVPSADSADCADSADSADSEDGEHDDPGVSLSVGFMVVPGFHVNRIVVHSRVYTVKVSN